MSDKFSFTGNVKVNLTSKLSPSTNAGDAGTPDEFGKFADLTRGLVSVPKTEIDEKRRDGS